MKEIVKKEPANIETMRERMANQSAIIDEVHSFVESKLFVKGTHYGQADMRSQKNVLLKPGAEVLCKLIGARPRWRNDHETFEMIGKPEKTVCFICELIGNDGQIIAEGRGAEEIGNKGRDANKAIKIAEKCALVDAVLYAFCLSDKFTQDDGGRTSELTEAKRELLSYIDERRVDVESEMTGVVFCQKVVRDLLKRSQVQTIGEVNAIRSAIEDGKYNLATAEKI